MRFFQVLTLTSLVFVSHFAFAAIDNSKDKIRVPKSYTRSKIGYVSIDQRPFFDLPVTYNSKVKQWIRHYQGEGRDWFKERLSRGYMYMPVITQALEKKGLPQDLAYIAMIESGFSAQATSHAKAVGYWQFIPATAERYGLKMNWWIDERKDFVKSTIAAANYLADLYKIFQSWYLTASAYNMGEGRLKRLVTKYNTYNYWVLAETPLFPDETKDYIPKLIAAMLISKAPRFYGFTEIDPQGPLQYNYISVPGGTDLYNLSSYLKLEQSTLESLNPELLQGFVPGFVRSHLLRVPKGYAAKAANFVRTQM